MPRKRISWKSVDDDDMMNSLMRTWGIFRIHGSDPFIEHGINDIVRNITKHAGERNMFETKKAEGILRVDVHHVVEVKDLTEEWWRILDSGGEFLESDARRWLDSARSLRCTPEEHVEIHGKEFKKLLNLNVGVDFFDVLTYYGIEHHPMR